MKDLDAIASVFLVTTPEPRYFLDDHCANCLSPLTEDVIGLWCSTWCTDINQRVRYWRRVTRDGRIADPLIRAQIGMDLTFLLIGGYRALGRRPSSATRMLVVRRDGGRCRKCGKPGTELDHVDGNSDEPVNLQLLCKDCHRHKTSEALASMAPAPDEVRAVIFALQLARVEPAEPTLLADDEAQWEHIWKRLTAERKGRFEAALKAVGFQMTKSKRSRLQIIAMRDAHLARDSR